MVVEANRNARIKWAMLVEVGAPGGGGVKKQ